MTQHTVHTHFPGRLIFIGFGSIGQGVLPLIMRHVGGLTADRITIVTADDAGRQEAEEFGEGELAVDGFAVARLERVEDARQAQLLELRGELGDAVGAGPLRLIRQTLGC